MFILFWGWEGAKKEGVEAFLKKLIAFTAAAMLMTLWCFAHFVVVTSRHFQVIKSVICFSAFSSIE